MNDKLQELTDRLYKDGVEKARKEADAILAEAEKQKEEIIQKAESDAAAILEKGRKDSEDLRSRTESELAMAARQAEGALKQRIVNILSDNVLKEGVRGALDNETLLNDLIVSTMAAWASDGNIPDITLILSEDKKDVFIKGLKSSLKKQIDEGLNIEFSGRMKSGFRIESKDGSYAMSFTDKDFEEFFRSFIKEKSRSALFGEN
jgi:V/A-type H+-transporting ATPase subunit E